MTRTSTAMIVGSRRLQLVSPISFCSLDIELIELQKYATVFDILQGMVVVHQLGRSGIWPSTNDSIT